MFQSQSACTVENFPITPRHAFFSVQPGLIARRLLPVLAAGGLVMASASVPHETGRVPAYASPVIVQDASVTTLRDKAEAMRSEMARLPGVAAVTITGLRQQGLSVEYMPHRLSGFGLAASNLAAVLPVDPVQSRPGHLVLRPEAAGDMQAVANLPVHAGGQVFRLGDVAMVMRAPLQAPVSTMNIEGQPAAQLSVVLSK